MTLAGGEKQCRSKIFGRDEGLPPRIRRRPIQTARGITHPPLFRTTRIHPDVEQPAQSSSPTSHSKTERRARAATNTSFALYPELLNDEGARFEFHCRCFGIKARSHPERESAVNAAYGSFMVAITQHTAPSCTAVSHGLMNKHIAGNSVSNRKERA